MSNSFNISVKPEIAAVKADTADIRTDVTAIHDTNLPAVKTDTADIRTDVTAIHDTDLPAAKTVIDSNASNIGHIRNTAIPNVITEIDANETKIDTIDGIVDAILTSLGTTTPYIGRITVGILVATYTTVIDISAEGYLYYFDSYQPAGGVNIKITIDGTLVNFNDDGTPTGMTYFKGLAFFGQLDNPTTGGNLVSFPPKIIDVEDTASQKPCAHVSAPIHFKISLLIELQSRTTDKDAVYDYFYSLV